MIRTRVATDEIHGEVSANHVAETSQLSKAQASGLID
jgi:hypothetical protein